MTKPPTPAGPRTPEEVFADHGRRLGTGDLDSISANYAGDAVFITPGASCEGGKASRKASVPCWPICPTPTGS